LFGGLIGATVAGLGWAGVNWSGDGTKLDGVIGKVILPAVASPVIAGLVAMIGTWIAYRATARAAHAKTEQGFRWGQIVSASLVSLAHGTNDAQKTMGVITLALIAYGSWTDVGAIPLWVKVACACTIAAGTYVGGWRIIRTMGKGSVELESPQGMAAEGASAAVILASSQLGFRLSTTQVTTGSILGSGVGRPGARVRWGVAGRMLVAWVITMPCAGAVAAAAWWLADSVGGLAGALAITVILLAVSGLLYLQSRNEPISSSNVNDEWLGTPSAARRKQRVGQ
jgi:PiT family inorganic phosphate transporter